jgi:hypothetical protein
MHPTAVAAAVARTTRTGNLLRMGRLLGIEKSESTRFDPDYPAAAGDAQKFPNGATTMQLDPRAGLSDNRQRRGTFERGAT